MAEESHWLCKCEVVSSAKMGLGTSVIRQQLFSFFLYCFSVLIYYFYRQIDYIYYYISFNSFYSLYFLFFFFILLKHLVENPKRHITTFLQWIKFPSERHPCLKGLGKDKAVSLESQRWAGWEGQKIPASLFAFMTCSFTATFCCPCTKARVHLCFLLLPSLSFKAIALCFTVAVMEHLKR